MSRHPDDQDFDLQWMQAQLVDQGVVTHIDAVHQAAPPLMALLNGLRWFLQKAVSVYFDQPEIVRLVRLDCLSDGRAIEASIDLDLQPTPLAWVLCVEPTASGMTARGHLLTKIALDSVPSEMTDGIFKSFGEIESSTNTDFIETFYRLVLTVIRDFEQFVRQGLPQILEDRQEELKFYSRINRNYLGLL